ncbi:MAG: sugar phosphate isomerase/epimerase [Spirochaetes bacterium]|uniref:Sugar phosphate isomerase/epimerase n=1 Tax=Candidatus Ornithospirochaeta stercoripullorum TaxID=2840899 RepID=A0A9D9DZW4_9SPIO|nr:sugar phosphate isomerase/epimerase [Candidatus Ornithospirochaeta stercoripullorum]
MRRTIIANSNCYHGYSVYDALNGIAEAGFRNVELTCTRGWTEHIVPSMPFSELLRIKDALFDLSLSVPAVSGHSNLMDPERLSDFRDNIRLAAFFGASVIVSSVGEAHIADKEKLGDKGVAENIKTLLPLLEDLGMMLVLETHGEHGTATRLRAITDMVASERVKICYDTANAIFYGDVNGTEDLENAIDSIGYLHVKDKAGERTEWNFPALGDGYVDFPSIFRVLDKHSNPSMLSVEIEFTKEGAKNIEEVNEAMKKSARYLQSQGFEL